jgi:hypothetical protein
VLLIVAAVAGCSEHTPAEAPKTESAEEVIVKADVVGLYPELGAFVAERVVEFDEISDERKRALGPITDFVADRIQRSDPVRLTFICTHNSRRSHMSQIWAQTAAEIYGVSGVETYSGGTEATAFNPRAVAALQRAGFAVEPFTDGKNPIYEVSFEPKTAPMQSFSKVYDSPPNPTENFAAIMTCSAADNACPIVVGAAERIAIPFDDPKAFDGTEQEAAKYDERCAQIAREMLLVFSKVAARS